MKHCNLRPEKITVHPLSEKKKRKKKTLNSGLRAVELFLSLIHTAR